MIIVKSSYSCSSCKDVHTKKEMIPYETNNSNTLYFCSENCLNNFKKKIKEKEDKKTINSLIADILDTPPMTLADNELNTKIYPYYKEYVVLQYLQENKDKLYTVMKPKDFDTIMYKIKYFIVIMQNELVKYTFKDYDKHEYGYCYEPTELVSDNKTKKKKRKSLREIQNEYINKLNGGEISG